MSSTELRRLTVRGAEIHYQDIGAGVPVICVHGSLGDYRSWSLQVPALSAQHRVISYSRRFHFPNAWPAASEPYSAGLHADDLCALMDSLELDSAHIVSASYGSYCSLVFAQRYPSRVRSLVVAEPPILGWLRSLRDGDELIRPFFENAWNPSRAAFVRGEDEEAVRLFIDGVMGRPGAFDRSHPGIKAALIENAAEMRAETLSDRLFSKFGCDEARTIQARVLLLSGERSPSFFQRITEELSLCLPNSEHRSFPGAYHNLNSSRPRQYNEVILQFLGSNSAS